MSADEYRYLYWTEILATLMLCGITQQEATSISREEIYDLWAWMNQPSKLVCPNDVTHKLDGGTLICTVCHVPPATMTMPL